MQAATILVVEDDPNVSTVLTARLESLGYRICGTAETGPEAIEGVQRLQPDVVTMDILLKGRMNGIEAAEAIGGLSDVPIIFMTCLADRENFDRAIRTNPYGYIVKPYDTHELRSAVEIAIVNHARAKAREALINRLESALAEIKALRKLLPICSACKSVRTEDDHHWQRIEEYMTNHLKVHLTHGICPDCAQILYPDLHEKKG